MGAALAEPLERQRAATSVDSSAVEKVGPRVAH